MTDLPGQATVGAAVGAVDAGRARAQRELPTTSECQCERRAASGERRAPLASRPLRCNAKKYKKMHRKKKQQRTNWPL